MTTGLVLAAHGVLGCGATDEPTPEPVADVAHDSAPPGDGTASGDTPPDPPAGPFEQAGFPVTVDADSGIFALGPITSFRGGSEAYAESVASRVATEEVGFIVGFYKFAESGDAWVASGVESFDEESGAFAVDGDATLTLEVVGEGAVALTLTAPPGATRTSMAFECPDDERFLGFGAQTPAMEHRGARVPIWVAEQGINKGDWGDEDFPPPFQGRLYDSYYPVPFFVSPRGYGGLVENTERIIFELCSEDNRAWRVEAWSNELRLVFFSGEPLDVIERFTERVGRPPMPPDWALLPWLAVKGGTEVVSQEAKQVRAHALPVSAIWSEDWTGESINPITGNNLKYHWEWDPEHYPDLPGLIDELHDMDLRFLGYFNPFIVELYDEWGEAHEKGYLPLTPDGEPYEFPVLTSIGSVADLTNPAVVEWLQEHVQTALDMGMDGYMADFAEWVPFDAQFHDGRLGSEVSSDYPRLWQKAHAEVCHGECLFFVRSGYTGSHALAPAVWAGDQDTDFSDDDGLPTAVRIGVGLGITGVAFYGSDIAGYSGMGSDPSTRELYYRWTQLGAFSPIMRTHEGNHGPDVNWNYNEDEETLELFRRYAARHTALFPFFKSLLYSATQTGHPVIRHPALHYPGNADMLQADDTYLLGHALLVAPVTQEGATSREVTLPPGSWANWDSGGRHTGTITADAPLTEIPLYARQGALVPRIVGDIQTPAQATAAAAQRIQVDCVLGAAGSFELWDGTTLAFSSTQTADPGDAGLPVCADAAARSCTTVDGPRRTYRLDATTLVAGDFSFEASDASRAWDVTVLFAP